MEVSGQLHVPVALHQGKASIPVGWETGSQCQYECCEEEKNLAHTGNQTHAVQPIAYHYTD
jgi:hypothetical protein